MKVEILKEFSIRLADQVSFIAKDKPIAARKFKKEILQLISNIPENLYINRKSIYFEDILIRDLVFKGYIIVYRINKSRNRIEVFGFIKYRGKL